MSRHAEPTSSPCTGVCRMDDRNHLCLGCYRTLDEIAAWSALPDAQRRFVLDALRARRRQARLEASMREAGP